MVDIPNKPVPHNHHFDEVDLGLVTGGLTFGLGWRPGLVGISLDLTVGGSGITTEIKRAEGDQDWNLYERREVALFPGNLCSVSISRYLRVAPSSSRGDIPFSMGRGSEVGGPTASVAIDLGQWM